MAQPIQATTRGLDDFRQGRLFIFECTPRQKVQNAIREQGQAELWWQLQDMILVGRLFKQSDRQPAALQITALARGIQHRQRQVATNAVGHQPGVFINHPADHGHMLAQLAVDQATVDVAEHFRGLEIAQPGIAFEFKQQPGGHELQQHRDERR
ncbi:hypothetical protein D3C80_1428030 [compost metagenome]